MDLYGIWELMDLFLKQSKVFNKQKRVITYIPLNKFNKNKIGSNWNTRSIGVSFGTKTVYGGSVGVSITTPPLKF